jgi:hypothetical protein
MSRPIKIPVPGLQTCMFKNGWIIMHAFDRKE